jgi:ADP-ribosyl-[dinitrogen reductase] hydrolase
MTAREIYDLALRGGAGAMHENTKQMRNRYHGALLGLAAGDALGTTLEFKSPGTFRPLTDMQGGGPFNLQPGQWTDDTSMALCLAESLVRMHGFDAEDQMSRYVRWWDDGYLSSTGECFDIGMTVCGALSKYLQTGNPFAGSTDPHTAGNGSLMRLVPVPLAYRANPGLALQLCRGKLTNHARRAHRGRCVPLLRRADSRRARWRIERGIAGP